jgi:hypothetical protein
MIEQKIDPIITWKPDPAFWSANRAEHAFVDDHELVAFDLPPTPGFESRDIAWEIFRGPSLLDKIAGATAASFEEAKAAAESAYRDLRRTRIDSEPSP